ncbi:hypothetical protein, conserved [Trypanosoma brucei brucei TREU927]|uniref:Uncharacterized protein n=1 Tax=Trypanosoma brucei brucei (strain 927/4 GUTat10.1) TaxID=185431 RepID=Q580F4_TRYB2|nr:hypothetical protein, conserved [Trypanosoma brucei brucei TREU927]AAX79775.1 hypothetical protein, conserved [Trypanosoma brucei]AAZ12937.1 hypothetical protein, conserved [Trypanosoma brucei brucei TREU927]
MLPFLFPSFPAWRGVAASHYASIVPVGKNVGDIRTSVILPKKKMYTTLHPYGQPLSFSNTGFHLQEEQLPTLHRERNGSNNAMPLKFVHQTDRHGSDVSLALLCKLRHEGDAVLRSYTASGISSSEQRHRPLRSLPHAREMLHNYEVAAMEPSRLPLLPACSTVVNATTHREGEHSCPGAGSFSEEVEPPPLLRPLQVTTVIQWLFIKHGEFLLMLTPRCCAPGACGSRSKLLQRALAGSTIRTTWHDALSVFHCASRAVTLPPAAELLVDEPTLPSAIQLVKPQWSAPHSADEAAAILDGPIIPHTSLLSSGNGRSRLQSSMRRCLLLESVIEATRLGSTVTSLQCHIKEVALHGGSNCQRTGVADPQFPQQPPLRVGNEVEVLFGVKDVGTGGKELQRIVVPYTTHDRDCDPAFSHDRRNYRRRRHAKRGGALRRASEQWVVPAISQNAELKLPDGKQLRRTLTLRNIAAENLRGRTTSVMNELRELKDNQSFCDGTFPNGGKKRPLRHRYFPGLWLFVGTSAAQLCSELAASSVSRGISHPLKGLPPVGRITDCDEQVGNKFRCWHSLGERPLSPWSEAGASTNTVPDFSELWIPLAVAVGSDGNCEAGSDSKRGRVPLNICSSGKGASYDVNADKSNIYCYLDCCSAEEVRMFPPRVFSRWEELQCFKVLSDGCLGQQPPRLVIHEMNNEGRQDVIEKWYNAAYEHDVCTMPLPYRGAATVADDAKLHYCYRLALHRERRRLGFDAV